MVEFLRRLGPVVFAASLCVEVAAHSLAEPPRNRSEFAKAMAQIDEGMAKDAVLALLSQPDDVRTEHDPGGISTVRTKEIWQYGTSGHLTTATLGQVYLDQKDRVQYVFGKGTPPPDGVFDEQELRTLIDALGEVPSYNGGWHYNPRRVIRAVNLLQPLGKEKVLMVIEEFLRVASHWHDDGREGVFLVLRTLFEVPDDPGFMPPMYVGAPHPSQPEDKKLLPRFPITIEGDIPLLLVEGYSLAGQAEEPGSHVEYFREHGTLRREPLAPSSRPFDDLARFEKSPRWRRTGTDLFEDNERRQHFLNEQLLRLLDTVYRVEAGRGGSLLPFGKQGAERRAKLIQGASSLQVQWDTKRHKYTFADGTSLPEPDKKQYRREIWRPNVDGLDLEVILERDARRRVSIWVVQTYKVGKATPVASLKVVRVKAKDEPLVKFNAGGEKDKSGIPAPTEIPNGTSGISSTWKPIELDEGDEIQIELIVEDQSYRSPVFTP